MHHPLINHSNTAPYHFIHGFAQCLEQQLNARIPLTAFRGNIHLAPVKKSWMSQVDETRFRGPFWVMMAGGKFDFTAKWWNASFYQEVAEHFRGRIPFVQCGQAQY